MSKTYTRTGDYEFTSEETPEQTLIETRARASEVMKEEHGFMLRSCWVCNRAHVHLIAEADAVLSCFGCGHYYLGGVDVTIFGEEEE